MIGPFTSSPQDVLYQLEVNTFKDGLLAANDHAGVGLMLTRLGEGGRVDKGPMGYGLRLQVRAGYSVLWWPEKGGTTGLQGRVGCLGPCPARSIG